MIRPPVIRHTASISPTPISIFGILTIVAVSAAASAEDADPSVAALSCLGCHAENADEAEPRALDRIGPREIVSALRAYRANRREGTIMNRIARGLSDGEIEGIANFLGKP